MPTIMSVLLPPPLVALGVLEALGAVELDGDDASAEVRIELRRIFSLALALHRQLQPLMKGGMLACVPPQSSPYTQCSVASRTHTLATEY